ncbi:MAG: hypothetical protein QXK45_02920 [Thermofilaceae archaeon]
MSARVYTVDLENPYENVYPVGEYTEFGPVYAVVRMGRVVRKFVPTPGQLEQIRRGKGILTIYPENVRLAERAEEMKRQLQANKQKIYNDILDLISASRAYATSMGDRAVWVTRALLKKYPELKPYQNRIYDWVLRSLASGGPVGPLPVA